MATYKLPRDTGVLVRDMTRNGFNTAHRTIEAYVENDEYPHNVCVNAGMAVEIVVKACLLERSPSLVLDSRPSDTALRSVAGLRDFGPMIDFPTIGFGEAMRRMLWVWPTFPYTAASDSALLSNRNAAAHSGLASQDEATQSVRIMVRLTHWVYENPFMLRERPRSSIGFQFWQPYEAVAEGLARDDLDAVRIRVLGKMAESRGEFKRRYGDLTAAQTKSLFYSLTQQRTDASISDLDGYRDITLHKECPSCGNLGWLMAEIEDVDYDIETEGDNVISAAAKRVAHPIEFNCPICGFTVWHAETAAAGMGEDIDLGWATG